MERLEVSEEAFVRWVLQLGDDRQQQQDEVGPGSGSGEGQGHAAAITGGLSSSTHDLPTYLSSKPAEPWYRRVVQQASSNYRPKDMKRVYRFLSLVAFPPQLRDRVARYFASRVSQSAASPSMDRDGGGIDSQS